MSEFEQLRQQAETFTFEREWDKFHSPKNLAMALTVEASELLECFQWLTEAQSYDLSPEQLSAVADEIADVQMYLVRIADKLGVNIMTAVDQKMVKNTAKYPIEKAKGSSKKYTEY